jgi:capsular exopolysaccharide synthesis family protein
VLIGKEAFRGLRTNIRFALQEQPRLMAITSSAPGEGKSTIAVNLALTLAEQGARVLLIDADLRRPQVHRILGVERVPGLSDVLMGQVELEHAIVPSPVHPGLSVLPGGAATGSPAELVGGDLFMNMVLGLRDHYDTVLVDTSPVLAVTDAALIGTVADGTLVVVRANETDQGALSRAVEQLRRVNANLVGIVLNDVPLDNVGYSSYYDSYYDGQAEDTRTRHLLRSGTGNT